MNEPVIIEALRTPLARKDGAFASIRPEDLYTAVINEVMKKSGVDPAQIEDLVTGIVSQVGEQGANLSRQAALLSNLPITVPGVTLNRMCGSSQQAIHFAAQAIGAGDAKFNLAGGVESMTRVPMFSDIQGGFEKLAPSLLKKHNIIHQGESAERIAEKYELSREMVDDFSFQSHVRAAKATQDGIFASQIVPIEGKDKEGKPVLLKYDEGIRFQAERSKMGKLPTIFRPNGGGVVTAANASQISDGAAVVLLADRDAATKAGLKPRARFRARVAVGGDPTLQLMEVVPATRKALERAQLKLSEIDVIEVNEAFASVVLGWAKELHPDMDRVNPNGGAIAHGHPLGATGAVLMTKLLYELERRRARYGLQVMCIGHGMATATIIERI